MATTQVKTPFYYYLKPFLEKHLEKIEELEKDLQELKKETKFFIKIIQEDK